MASDLVLTGCSTEGDLAALAQGVLDQAALVRDQILQQVQAVNPAAAQSLINTLNGQYDQVISPADNTIVSAQIGLLPEQPTEADDESRLEPLGLIMIRGIIYAVGTETNIDQFRKLFFAVGSNVNLFLQLVHSTDSLIVVQTRLIVQKLPTTQQTWTIEQARTLLQNDAIEEIYVAGDSASYVVVPQFLAVNKSAQQTAFELNIDRNEIVTQVFWLRSVDTSSARINQLTSLGLDADERTSILTGQAVKDVAPTSIETTRVISDQLISQALSQINLLNSRFSQLDAPSKTSLRNEILLSISQDRTVMLTLERQVRFQPVLITRPEDIDDFLVLNSQADLPYLFATRRTVSSINFQVSQTELSRRIVAASNIPSGSNTVSSILSNTTGTPLDQDVSSTNQSLVFNECGNSTLSKPGDLRWLDLNTSFQCLSSIKVRPTVTAASNVPVIGYQSFDSPSSIMVRRADLYATLKIPNIFDNIIALARPISDALTAALQVLIAMIKQLRAAIDAVLKPLIAKVQAIVAQIESFISRHMSYFGQATVDSSILKCALNLDLQPSLPFLDDIAPFLDQLRKELKNLLAQIAQIISDFLSKLLCLPITFLNNMLKSATSFLPAICKTDTFKLPPDLEAALVELRDGFQVESTNFTNFSRNLLRLQADIQTIPAKVTQFREDLACNQTPLNSRFMTVFRKDVNTSIGTNPISSIASGLGSTIGGLVPPRG